MNDTDLDNKNNAKKHRSTTNRLYLLLIFSVTTLLLAAGVILWAQLFKSNECVSQLEAQVDTLGERLDEIDSRVEHYLIVREWGVKLPQNANRDLYYEVGEIDNTILFGSKAMDQVCEGSGIQLLRGTADHTIPTAQPGEDTPTYKETYESFQSSNRGISLIIGDYYYIWPLMGPSACPTDLDKQALAFADIREHIKLMRAL